MIFSIFLVISIIFLFSTTGCVTKKKEPPKAPPPPLPPVNPFPGDNPDSSRLRRRQIPLIVVDEKPSEMSARSNRQVEKSAKMEKSVSQRSQKSQKSLKSIDSTSNRERSKEEIPSSAI